MALTRKLLKSFSLEESVIDSIIDAHTESIDALKKQRDDALAEAAKVEALTKDLHEANDKLSKAGDAAKVQRELDDLKASVAAEKTAAATRAHARSLLKNDVGIKRESALDLILAAENLDAYERDETGKIKDPAAFVNAMKEKHAEWIGEVSTEGTPPTTPPSGGAKGTMTLKDILGIKDVNDRQRAIAENINLFERK